MMAVILSEGFDGWVSTADNTAEAAARNFPFSWRGQIIAANASRTGKRLQNYWSDGNSRIAFLGGGVVSPISYSTFTFGGAVECLVGLAEVRLLFQDINNITATFTLSSSGWFMVYNPAGTGNDINASGPIEWAEHYVEVVWTPTDFSLYINNELKYTKAWTGVAVNFIAMAPSATSGNNNIAIDDVYMVDTSTRRGMHRIVLLSKGTATDNTGTYTGAGTNITGTNSFDGDTTYYTLANAAGQQLMFPITATPLPATVDVVHDVKLTVGSRKTSSGAYAANAQITRSGVDYNVGAVAAAVSYAGAQIYAATDPSTSAAWTKAGVEAMEFGVKGA